MLTKDSFQRSNPGCWVYSLFDDYTSEGVIYRIEPNKNGQLVGTINYKNQFVAYKTFPGLSFEDIIINFNYHTEVMAELFKTVEKESQ